MVSESDVFPETVYDETNDCVLMALMDADYKFIYIDVSWNGRISYVGIFAGCILSETGGWQTS